MSTMAPTAEATSATTCTSTRPDGIRPRTGRTTATPNSQSPKASIAPPSPIVLPKTSSDAVAPLWPACRSPSFAPVWPAPAGKVAAPTPKVRKPLVEWPSAADTARQLIEYTPDDNGSTTCTTRAFGSAGSTEPTPWSSSVPLPSRRSRLV